MITPIKGQFHSHKRQDFQPKCAKTHLLTGLRLEYPGPTGGTYSAPPDHLPGFRGPGHLCGMGWEGRERSGWEEREGKRGIKGGTELKG